MSRHSAKPDRAWFGQAASLLALLVIGVIFVRFSPGEWRWSTDPQRIGWALAASVLFFAAWGFGARRRAARKRAEAGTPLRADGPLPVFHASQTGFAQQLAEQTALALQRAGVPACAKPLTALDVEALATVPRALFIASTTGEGDAPDALAGFVRRTLAGKAPLPGLHYGLLALGDRHYTQFCAFGRQLDAWLQAQGATPMFPSIEVDNADPAALERWRDALAQLGGKALELPQFDAAPWQDWHLVQRQELNPGSQGEPVFQLQLQPVDDPLPAWRAGDIAEVLPQHAPETLSAWFCATGLDPQQQVDVAGTGSSLIDHVARCELPEPAHIAGMDAQQVADTVVQLRARDYSIASIPADGSLELLVRQGHRPDGSLGLAAGWLTRHAAPGKTIALRLRSNPNFHAPDDDVPLILIGNGTGLAALRALLRERIAAGRHANWLLFGERQRSCDFFHGVELEAALAAGHLSHLDLAFSRDGAQRVYVQHLLQQQAERLQDWIEAGACIHVCGSLEGMAGGVDAALRSILGDARMQHLAETGHYRRDVY